MHMNNLEKFFQSFADSSGVPVVDKENWQKVVENHGKPLQKESKK